MRAILGRQFIGQRIGEVVLRRIAATNWRMATRRWKDARALRAFEATGTGQFFAEEIPRARRDQDEQRRDPSGEQGSVERFFGTARLRLRGPDADLKGINPDRLGDVLELGRAEIGDRQIKPSLDLPICLLGKTDRARLANALEPRGNIDAVAHEIAIALLDDVAQMNSDAELDPALGRQAGVALDEAALHLDRAAHRVDDAAKLDDDFRRRCA